MDLNESIKLKKTREELVEHAKQHPLYTNVLETSGNIVFGRGSDVARILFIGEAPGFTENAQGKPFVGRSGKLLEEWVKELGIKNEDYAIMNVVPIIPLSKDKKIRPPTPDEIEYFLPYTKRMIEAIAPEVIVPLGRSAGSIFNKSLKLGDVKSYPNYKLFFIYHPAYYLRNGRKGFEDLKNLKKILNENDFKAQSTLNKFG
jgi:uracil-DNA glycosylase